VSRWGTRSAALLAAAALLASAGLLSSCGGSGSDSGSTATKTSGETEAEAGGKGGSGKSRPSELKGGEGEAKPNGSVPVSPLRVSGGGSGQFRVKGGDNSIQDFGDEASESELEEAAKALHDFYVARAREEWRRACANLSQAIAGQLEQLAEQAKQGQVSCPTALAAITPGLGPKVARETTAVDAGSLRREGDRGFLIYRDGEGTVYAINMASEDGWKVGALVGVPLS
jgi:hypothetical protein